MMELTRGGNDASGGYEGGKHDGNCQRSPFLE